MQDGPGKMNPIYPLDPGNVLIQKETVDWNVKHQNQTKKRQIQFDIKRY